MYYFVEFACVIAEMWMIHGFLVRGQTLKKTDVWVWLVAYCLFGGTILGLSFLENMAFVRIGVTLCGVWVLGMLVYKNRLLSAFLEGLVVCAFVAVTDVLTTVLFTCCGVTAAMLVSDVFMRSLYLIVGHFLMLAMVNVVSLLRQQSRKAVSIKALIWVSPCWLVSLLLCILLTWDIFIYQQSISPWFLVVLVGLLYTNMLVIYYINRVAVQMHEKKEYELAEHHYAMQKEYYEQFRIQQEETRALWHDISKYLRASQVEGTSNALIQVQQMLDGICCVVDVNNRVVSIILNEYAQIAREEQIALEMDVQVPEVLFVSAADLYVLIGNTMDNAVEACMELPEEQRRISIKLKTHNDILFYQISNPYRENHLCRVRNRYHGYGLKNVEKCVEKYHGTLCVTREKDNFCVAAHLNAL